MSGLLQFSHLHILTDINMLIHYDASSNSILAATAYSIPDPTKDSNWGLKTPRVDEGAKIIRLEPVQLRFRVGWAEGLDVPGTGGKGKGSGEGSWVVMVMGGVAVYGLCWMLAGAWERWGRQRIRGRKGSFGNGLLGGNKGGNGYAWTAAQGHGGGGFGDGLRGGGGGGGRIGKRD
jgi:hypothetical protein